MNDRFDIALGCHGLRVEVPGRSLVDGLAFALRAGEFLAVLGQNGAGKSLTLHTLAGLRKAAAGKVELHGLPLNTMPRQAIAQGMALLPQHSDDAFPASVFDTALAGRHPHVPRLQWESPADREIAADCLRLMNLQELHGRDIATLSGGERRRLAVAQVLAQSPEVYLLDEPTNHLDPQHQLDVLNVFAARAASGKTVVASLHDVNLAARYATSCLLLFGDGRWRLGPAATILSASVLSELYATPMEALPWRDRQLFVASGAPPPQAT
ncbi:MAG: ABC transporter ATP-binding protein [Halioglobus sp.]|nr:ABC transporter ATP-binding protein [Halioglobus sp.]